MRQAWKASRIAFFLFLSCALSSGVMPERAPSVPEGIGFRDLILHSPRALWAAYEAEAEPERKRTLEEAFEASLARCTHFEVVSETRCDD